MAGFPIPDGATWDGVTGREWEASGDLERFEFAAEDLVFRLYHAANTSTPGVWGSWTNQSDHMQAFNVNRQVADWYLGPRAATGTITVEDTGGSHPFDEAGKIRVGVVVPSGEKTLFEGLITDITHVLDADKYPTLRLTVTDWAGYESQQTYTETGSGSGSGLHIRIVLAGASYGAISTSGTQYWEVAGVSQWFAAATYNYLDHLSQIIRGELGILWVRRTGEWAYQASGWWNRNNQAFSHAVAAIGSDAGTPSTLNYGYRFPASRTRWVSSLRNQVNDLTWNTPHAPTTVHTSSHTGNINLHGTRKRADTVLLQSNAVAQAQADLLIAKQAPAAYEGVQVTFPADLTSDSMEYAATAEIADWVSVAMESLEDYWQEWVAGSVLAVGHSWSPLTGWNTTLRVTTRLTSDGE